LTQAFHCNGLGDGVVPFKKTITVVVILLIAEVLASMLVWSGKPMDGTWEPSFWRFEASRLRYWVLFISVFLATAQFAWYGRYIYGGCVFARRTGNTG